MSRFLRNYQYLVGDDPNRQYNEDTLKEYVEGEVTTAVTGLINMAPGQLDTLGEIATAIQNNPDFLTTLQGRDADLLAAIGISAGAQNVGALNTPDLTDYSSVKQLFEEVGEAAYRLRLGLGVPQGASNMGTFSGTTIPDNSTVAAALQALETLAEAEVARVDALIASDMWLFADQASFPPAASNHGRVVHSHADGAEFYAHAGQWIQLANHTSMESADTALSSRLDLLEADPVTKTYVDAEVAAVIDAAPGALDTLNELAASLGDDSNFVATVTNQVAAVQADVDANEADSDAADAALSGRLDALEADPTTQTALTAEASTRAAADTALSGRLDTLEADPTTATAVAAVQADVDANEATALAARNAIQADVDANEVDRRAVVDIQSNITSVKNAVRGTSIEVGNNIALHPAAGGRVEVEGDLLLDNQTDIIDGTGVTLTSFTNINAYDGRLTTLEADPTTSAAVTAGDAATLVSANAYTDAEIASLIDASPGALDTLNELAAAMGDDANFATTVSNQIAAVQADVDQNETDSDAADAALSGRLDVLEADPTTATALAAVQADVDANETASDAAEAALSGRLDVLEADPTTATALAAVQADVDQNEADADAAIAAILDGATFTGDVIIDEGDGPTIKLETSQDGNAGIVLNGGSGTYSYIDTTNGFGNDNLQIYSNNTWCRAINGGTGNLIVDGTLTLAGTALTATFAELNFVDGVTSNVQTQLDAKLSAETITLTSFKAVVAASSDFADFQSRVAAL